jgi:hypothetical protein
MSRSDRRFAACCLAVAIAVCIGYQVWFRVQIWREQQLFLAEGHEVEDLPAVPVPEEKDPLTYYRQAYALTPDIEGGIRCNVTGDAETAHYIESHRDVFPLIEKGLDLPAPHWSVFANPPTDNQLHNKSEDLYHCSTLCQVLMARAGVLARHGKTDEAIDDCIRAFELCHQLRRYSTNPPSGIVYSAEAEAVVSTDFILRRYPVSAASLQRLRTVLAAHRLPPYTTVIAQTRADALGRRDDAWLLETCHCLQQLRDAQRNAELPFAEHLAASQQDDMVLNLRLLYENIVALRRCLAVMVAWKEHQLQGGNPYPTLDDLELTEEDRTDPFTGKRLVLNHRSQGPIVYSLGANQVDNSGSFEPSEIDLFWAYSDVGLAEECRIVYRLPTID